MVLVDSSSWVAALRQSGKDEVRQRVLSLLAAGQAAWCDPVRLELWNGARGDHERRILRLQDDKLPRLPIDEAVWDLSMELAKRSRDVGLTVPAVDLIIAACARRHGVALEHDDRHLVRLMELQGV